VYFNWINAAYQKCRRAPVTSDGSLPTEYQTVLDPLANKEINKVYE